MIRWIVLGLLFWLAFVISQIPAAWGGYLMTRDTPLALSGISGTLWQGSAGMASVSIDGKHYALGQLSWRIKPMSLLGLAPCAEIKTDLERQQVAGTACVGMGGSLRLTDTSLNLPASLIQGLPEPTKITGQISAQIQSLRLKGQTLKNLEGKLSWTQARLHNGQSWLQLGAFAADLSETQEGEIRADVFSLEGPIDLAGNVVMPLTGGIHIDGEFAFTDTFAREVQAEQWLPLMAEPLDNGKHRLRLSL
ncbi:type II secretion system protein N [Gilvimarinus agarilyticus]|uniref:type II secretion system protein N n=1 Tax=unclassified Gilvimarinus TaxID=2642066 RepID=UPI001C08CFB6|nr:MULTISPECIES: type II secretion system protein N [unclassified Gilvimarinus]MBU2886239.1 type II secretion system protein N [Gilvimarinus agarilyticus]MDO6570927.1 type II secretion system protein N [Gilvimarinus sp. 2_MG-2023]MDO6747786.1 type II secretion system protein N [Gilvimarinus sp. 1_MG-2023]